MSDEFILHKHCKYNCEKYKLLLNKGFLREVKMETTLTFKSNLSFSVQARDHHFVIDASPKAGGENLGPSPKEYLLSAIASCSGMDVVSLLRKMRIGFETFEINADAEAREEHPRIFKKIHVAYRLLGNEIKSEKVIQAVEMSMGKYCGVSAMVVQTVPIYYSIFINDSLVNEGKSEFK